MMVIKVPLCRFRNQGFCNEGFKRNKSLDFAAVLRCGYLSCDSALPCRFEIDFAGAFCKRCDNALSILAKFRLTREGDIFQFDPLYFQSTNQWVDWVFMTFERVEVSRGWFEVRESYIETKIFSLPLNFTASSCACSKRFEVVYKFSNAKVIPLTRGSLCEGEGPKFLFEDLFAVLDECTVAYPINPYFVFTQMRFDFFLQPPISITHIHVG